MKKDDTLAIVERLRAILKEAIHRANEDDRITVPLSYLKLLRSGLEESEKSCVSCGSPGPLRYGDTCCRECERNMRETVLS